MAEWAVRSFEAERMAGLGAHCSVAAVGEHIDLVVVLPIHVAGLGAREVEAVPSLAAVVVRHKVIVAEEPHKVAAEGEGPSPAGPEEVLDYTAREEERCILDLGDTEVLRKELEGDHRAVGHLRSDISIIVEWLSILINIPYCPPGGGGCPH